MGHTPVAKPSPILREWTFRRRGLLIGLLLLGIVALSGVVLLQGSRNHPRTPYR